MKLLATTGVIVGVGTLISMLVSLAFGMVWLDVGYGREAILLSWVMSQAGALYLLVCS